jgi:non-heme chloroperoxidase
MFPRFIAREKPERNYSLKGMFGNMPYIEKQPQGKIFYQEFGQGASVVFTNAGLLTHKQWDNQVTKMAREFKTITYDWSGTGASDRPNITYDAALAVDTLCSVIEHCNAGPAILVGHGVGAHVSILAALQRPDLVRGIVLVSGAPWYRGDLDGAGGFSDEFMEFWHERMSLKIKTSPEAISDLSDTYLYHEAPHPAVAAAVLMQAVEWPLYVFQSYTADLGPLDFRNDLPKISCPTLIMHGRHDRKQRYEGGVYFSKNIKNAKLVTFENSAHMSMYEEVSRFTEELSQFVREEHLSTHEPSLV